MSGLALGDHVLVKIKASARSATPKSTDEENGLPESEQPMGHMSSTRSLALLEEPGVVRFIGETQFEVGEWVGVELRTPCGKNDGSVRGVRYFECEENYGIFVRRNGLVRVDPITLEALSSSPAGQAKSKEEAKRLLDPEIQILAEEAKKECGPMPRKVDADAEDETQWTFEKWFDSLGFAKAFANKVEGAVWPAEASCGKLMWVFMRQLVRKDGGNGKELLRTLLGNCDVLETLVETLWNGGQVGARHPHTGREPEFVACAGGMVSGRAAQASSHGPPLEELARDDAASGRELHRKFVEDGSGYEMSYGTLTGFSGGLDQLIGPPSPDLMEAMEEEHDDESYFKTGHSGITTCPKVEWMFATGQAAPGGRWPEEDKEVYPQQNPRRQSKPKEWLVAKMAWKNDLLREHDTELILLFPEVIGLRLYTGPMGEIYNRLLRALAHRKKCDRLNQDWREMEAKIDKARGKEKGEYRAKAETLKTEYDKLQDLWKKNVTRFAIDGHKYATTIRVISSGLVKLGKIQKAEKVYRGLCGGILPAQFWEKDALGFCGGVENAFLNTTRDRQEALIYATRHDGHAATLFEIQTTMVDRAADLEWISQYPFEKPMIFAPFTGLQVLSTFVEGSHLVVQARVSSNLIPLMIEEYFAKRLNVVKQWCEELCDEVHNYVLDACGTWEQAAKALGWDKWSKEWRWAVGQLRQSLAAHMEMVTARDAQEMTQSETFVEAIRDAVEFKNKFYNPTRESIMPFLTPELVKFDIGEIGISALDVTDDFVQSVVARCKKLEHVRFATCQKLTDHAAMYIAVWCPGVQYVDFTACSGLTNRALQHLADGCTDLRCVDVKYCDQITEEGLQCLPPFCKALGTDLRGDMISSYGHESDFFGGLERLIGAACPDLLRAMEREHCDTPDSKVEFIGFYGIKTTAWTEWLFATGELPPDGGWPIETKDCRFEDCRIQRPCSWLEEQRSVLNAKLKECAVPELSWEEVLGLRLFTGPMYRQYRATLRAIARKRRSDGAGEQMEQGTAAGEGSQEGEAREDGAESRNLYTTTIHVISSALLKLGRIEEAGTVYKAIPSIVLPSHFWQQDAWGVRGGVERGFLACTRERRDAIKSAESYASGPGVVLEITTGTAGRGADLRWVSQYPHEARVWFPPLTMLEVVSNRVEGCIFVFELRPYVNCTSLTMEEVVGRRHKVLAEVCEELCDQVRSRAMQEGADWQEVADRRMSMVERMRRFVAGKSPAEMNDAGKFVDAIQDAAVLVAREFE